ncbi:MAG: hypothetical protein ACK56I_17785, partial [bacterium]
RSACHFWRRGGLGAGTIRQAHVTRGDAHLDIIATGSPGLGIEEHRQDHHRGERQRDGADQATPGLLLLTLCGIRTGGGRIGLGSRDQGVESGASGGAAWRSAAGEDVGHREERTEGHDSITLLGPGPGVRERRARGVEGVHLTLRPGLDAQRGQPGHQLGGRGRARSGQAGEQ